MRKLSAITKRSGERETFDQQAEPADHSVMQNDRKAVQPESISEKPENAADAPIPYPGENAGWVPMAGPQTAPAGCGSCTARPTGG